METRRQSYALTKVSVRFFSHSKTKSVPKGPFPGLQGPSGGQNRSQSPRESGCVVACSLGRRSPPSLCFNITAADPPPSLLKRSLAQTSMFLTCEEGFFGT